MGLGVGLGVRVGTGGACGRGGGGSVSLGAGVVYRGEGHACWWPRALYRGKGGVGISNRERGHADAPWIGSWRYRGEHGERRRTNTRCLWEEESRVDLEKRAEQMTSEGEARRTSEDVANGGEGVAGHITGRPVVVAGG